MPSRSDTNIFDDDAVFRLRVAEIVYSVLKERDLTINEVDKIKQAIRESLDLVFAQHDISCRDMREKEVRNIIDTKFTHHRDELDELVMLGISDGLKKFREDGLVKDIDARLTSFVQTGLSEIIGNKLTEYKLEVAKEQATKRELEIKEERSHLYKVLGIGFTVFSILLGILQLVLKLTGVL